MRRVRHCHPLLLSLLALGLLASRAAAVPKENAQQLFERGEKEFGDGHYEAARELFRLALELAPSAALPHWGLARAEERLDRCTEAIEHGGLFLRRARANDSRRLEIDELVRRCHTRRLQAEHDAEVRRQEAEKAAEAARLAASPPAVQGPPPPPPEATNPAPSPPPPGTGFQIAGGVLFAAGVALAVGGGNGLQPLSGGGAVASIVSGSVMAIGGTVLFGIGRRREDARRKVAWRLAPTVTGAGGGLVAAGSF